VSSDRTEIAASIGAGDMPGPSLTITSRAPHTSAASTAPSSTRCGRREVSSRSLALAGSVSEALTTTALARRRRATASSLTAVGKSAPPRPRRPLRPISSISPRPARGSGP
jgi:hypothetical protein